MRYFDLLGVQHVIMYFFPALAFVALFIMGLGFYYIHRKDSKVRETQIIEQYPGGIQGRNAPFPLVLILTITGTVIWVFAYIVLIGVLGVKI
jgi:Na+/H+ antiporter NhaC